MKKMISSSLAVAIWMSVNLAGVKALYGQAKEAGKPVTIRIEVVEELDGKINVTKRSYKIDNLPEGTRSGFVDKVLDSLRSSARNRRITVTVDEGRIFDEKKRRHRGNSLAYGGPIFFNDSIRSGIDSLKARTRFEYHKFEHDFRQLEADLRPKLQDLRKQLELKRFFRDGRNQMNPEVPQFLFTPLDERPFSRSGPGKLSTIQQLTVYPNQPNDGILNLRFVAQQKGDVMITVQDTKGKEIGRRELRDYSGTFVGQVELKRKVEGTVFVTVVQKDDGAVKRIVLSGLSN